MGTETDRLARTIRAEVADTLRDAESEALSAWDDEPIDPTLPTVVAIESADEAHGAPDDSGRVGVSEALRRVFELELGVLGALDPSRGDWVEVGSNNNGDYAVALLRGGAEAGAPEALVVGTVLQFQRVRKTAPALRIAANAEANADKGSSQGPHASADAVRSAGGGRSSGADGYAFTSESGLGFRLIIETSKKLVRIENLPEAVAEARLTSVESGVVVVVRVGADGLAATVGEPTFSDLLADIGFAEARVQLEILGNLPQNP